MPTYHEIMTTDLSTLTTAADRWDGMAAEFTKQEKAYKRDVHGITMGDSWVGLSAYAANRRFDTTLKEFQNAQVEAKAIASLLRDAHTQFVALRGKLKSARQDAVDAGMKVSDQGVVTFDTEKLTQGERTAYVHDPDYQDSVRKAVASWQQLIDQLVKDVGEADKGVEIAFAAVVIDSDLSDGTLNGFNGKAYGDIERYEAEAAAAKEGLKISGWVSERKFTVTGPDVGYSVTGPKYGKEASFKAYADLFHLTAERKLTNGQWKLSGIADVYGGARATANAGFTDKGLVAKAEASVGIRALAEGRAEYGPYAGAYLRAEGFAGAEAGTSLKLTREEITVGGKAFAGAKGGVAGGVEVFGIGVGGTAEGWKGPGAEAWWGVKKDEESGVWKLGGEAGVSPGIGGSLGLEITVDPDKVSQSVGAAADAVGDGLDAIGDTAGSVKDTVTGWF
ncbi:hypothetical protein [Streptomyces aurantiogriseus]|uniref:Uncharacterized protein n=1 Tax=Streptomyces aurantiogriseus TaxID=66870 RepID=A0A918BZR1_9ACTN|nr:hypothetical protein [Streptomyces aurantiogriseus]GGQ99637.1 hypothetical protein GCM10010251_13570 [Streptomyces aurantiogriseus]